MLNKDSTSSKEQRCQKSDFFKTCMILKFSINLLNGRVMIKSSDYPSVIYSKRVSKREKTECYFSTLFWISSLKKVIRPKEYFGKKSTRGKGMQCYFNEIKELIILLSLINHLRSIP